LLERYLARMRTEDVRNVELYVKARENLVRRGSRRALDRVRGAAGSVWRELTR
jgi:hypothetical protein